MLGSPLSIAGHRAGSQMYGVANAPIVLTLDRKRTAMKLSFPVTITALMMLSSGCQDRTEDPASALAGGSTTPAISPAKLGNSTDKWLGEWTGPEGGFLSISRKQGATYELEIHSLDGPNTYEGVAVGDQIEFKRDGKTETIRAGSGEETGMKWLQEKKNCLIIGQGEGGYCRD